MARKKSTRQREATQRRSEARQAAIEAAKPRCPICNDPLPERRQPRQVTCGAHSCQEERQRRVTRDRVRRFRARPRVEKAEAPTLYGHLLAELDEQAARLNLDREQLIEASIAKFLRDLPAAADDARRVVLGARAHHAAVLIDRDDPTQDGPIFEQLRALLRLEQSRLEARDVARRGGRSGGL